MRQEVRQRYRLLAVALQADIWRLHFAIYVHMSLRVRAGESLPTHNGADVVWHTFDAGSSTLKGSSAKQVINSRDFVAARQAQRDLQRGGLLLLTPQNFAIPASMFAQHFSKSRFCSELALYGESFVCAR